MGKPSRRTLGELYIVIAVKKQLLICEKYNFFVLKQLLNPETPTDARRRPLIKADFKPKEN